MNDANDAPDRPPDGVPPPGAPGRLWWYVAGWIALSALVALVALVGIHPHSRGPDHHATSTVARAAMPAGAVPADQSERSTGGSRGWLLRLRYAAVETYHRHGPVLTLTGCAWRDCAHRSPLGGYPADFVEAVRAEGSGRITLGPHAGRYLDWSAGSGFWLDSVPRDGSPDLAAGSAAAVSGTSLLPVGTPVRIVDCGTTFRLGTDGVCARLRATRWAVAALSGFGSDRVLELYVGPETGPGFGHGPWAATFDGAVLRVG